LKPEENDGDRNDHDKDDGRNRKDECQMLLNPGEGAVAEL